MNNTHQAKIERLAQSLTVQLNGKLLISKQRTAFLLDISLMTLDRLRKEGVINSIMVRGQVKIKVMELARYIVEN